MSQTASTWKDIFESVQSVVTTCALLLGGVWAYFKVVKGRVYVTRLEPAISGRIVTRQGAQYSVLTVSVKNVGLARVMLDTEHCTIEVKAYTADDYIADFHNAFLTPLGVVSAITKHAWIEPGECIVEDRLLALPAERVLALNVELRLLDRRPALSIRHNSVEWNAVAVVLPEDVSSAPATHSRDSAGEAADLPK